MDEADIEPAEAETDDDGDFGGDVSWSVLRTEGLWADDVSDTYCVENGQ